MYVRDEVADEIVKNHEAIQNHVQGKSMMIWLPGMTAGVTTQACLMFGGIGIAMAIIWLRPLTVTAFKYYIAGILIGSLPMAVLFNAIVRGLSSARRYMFRLSLIQVLVAVLAVVLSVLQGGKLSVGSAVGGLAFSLVAARLIASPSYALLAAIYRAQRAGP